MKKLLLISLVLCGMHSVATAQLGVITTIAGTGTSGHTGDGGAATAAQLDFPHGLAKHPLTGLIYFTEALNTSSNHYIRTIDPSTGIINTIAGTGAAGYNGDGIPATAATLSQPFDMVFDAAGNLYFCDETNDRVRRIDNTTGIITTIAGNGTHGYGGDGVVATSEAMADPSGIAIDAAGNLFISERHRIRKIDMSTGLIYNIGGSGSPSYSGDGAAVSGATFSFNNFLSFDNSGNLLVSDNGNHCVRKILAISGVVTPSSTITLLAGTPGLPGTSGDGGAATAAKLNYPGGILVNSADYIFIVDNDNSKIRGIDPATGKISTIGATGTVGFSGDGGPVVFSKMNTPRDILWDGGEKYYISDAYNNRVRRTTISSQPYVICMGQCITLASSMAGVSYSWAPSAGLSSSTAQYPQACPTTNTVYTVTVTDGMGGTSTEMLTVTVNPLPSGGTISGATAVCRNVPTTLTTTGTPGGTWTSSATTFATVGASSGVVTGAVLIGNAGAHTVTITYSVSNMYGCTASSTFNIKIKGIPSIYGSPWICTGELNTLTASPSSTLYGSGSWSCSACSTVTTAIIPPNKGTIISSATGAMGIATYTYTYTNPSDANYCSGSASVNMGAVAFPTLTVTGNNVLSTSGSITCSPSSSVLHVTGGSALGYTWSPSSSSVTNISCTSCGNPTITAVSAGAQVYTVSGYGSYCITPATKTYTVTVNACKPGREEETGVDAFSTDKTDVLVMPNPSNGTFTLTLPQGIAAAAITITDVTGKIVQTRIASADKTDFNMDAFPAGMYLITVVTEDKKYHVKLLKE